MVKQGILVTPDASSDILEGITRRSVIELAATLNIPVIERKVALTELYTAEEVFACGTSAFISPITEIDSRVIGAGSVGPLTERLRNGLLTIQAATEHPWITKL